MRPIPRTAARLSQAYSAAVTPLVIAIKTNAAAMTVETLISRTALSFLGKSPRQIYVHRSPNRLLEKEIMKRSTALLYWLLVALFILAFGKSMVASPPEQRQPTSLTADQALDKLRTGNIRFAEGKPAHPHEQADWRKSLRDGQHPFAVVLGCADSRVPPELIFDQGFGDLFVIRVAGNIVDTDVIASVEYAIDHLETPLMVVMGHTHCGAVSATVDLLSECDGEPAEVVSLLYRIEPAVMGVDCDLPRDERIAASIEKNVSMSVRRLTRVPDLRKRIKSGSVRVVGAVYDMETGDVRFLDGAAVAGLSASRKSPTPPK